MRRLVLVLVTVALATSVSASVMINNIRPWRGSTGVGSDAPSMVQLYNSGPADVDLSGWHIKSNAWTQAIVFWTLPANCYLFVVFDVGTSDTDFSDGVGILYTNNTPAFQRIADECGLYNGIPSQANIVDFVGWGKGGSSFGVPYTHAEAAGIWPLMQYVDLTNMTLFSLIARIPSGYDTDVPTDWQEVGREGCDHLTPHNSIQLEPRDGVLRDDITGLSWKPVQGATDYTVEVDDDENFGSIDFSQTTTNTSVPFTLGNGEWHWRVRPNLGATYPAAKWRFSKGAPDPGQTTWTSVPQKYQHKDSRLLCIYNMKNNELSRPGCSEDPGGDGPWDGPHPTDAGHIENCPHCGNYCARASIQMVNARYGGSLTQDEISYKGWNHWYTGPEGDLGHGEGMWPEWGNAYSWAMNNANITIHQIGAGAFPWDSLVTLIDRNRPVLAIKNNAGNNGLHAVVITGYSTTFGRQRIHVTDPWPNSTGWFENDRVSWKCYYALRETPTGRATDSNIAQDNDGDGVVDFDEQRQSSGQNPRAFCSLYNNDDTDKDEVKDKQEIRSYTFHDSDHGGCENDDWNFADIDNDGDRQECDCDGDDDSDFDGGEDINGDGENPIGGLETCEYTGPHAISVGVLMLWGWPLCFEDVYAFGQTYHNFSTYPAELIFDCPGHNDGDPLFNNLTLFAAEDGIIHPQYIGSFSNGIYQLTVDVLKDALYSEPDNLDPLVCFPAPPHILIVPPPPYPTPIPPPPYPTPVPTGDYDWALLQLGKYCVVYDYPWGGPGPSLDTLLSYPVVIWCTGALQGTMSSQDATNLMQYIDLGGKVFFTGAEIAKDAMTSGDVSKVTLLNQYMGALYAGENPGCRRIHGVPDSFFDVFTDVQIDRYNDIYWDYQSPDAVAPAAITQPLAGYSESADCMPGAYAGFATEGPNGLGGRSVYLSFPWESIVEEGVRVEMLDIILQWLYGEPPHVSAVEDLTVYRSEEGIALDWTPTPGTISYKIYASDHPDFEPEPTLQITTVEVPPFVDPDGFDFEKRFYVVVAEGTMGEGEFNVREWITQQSDINVIRERLDAEGIHYREFQSEGK